jgi:hypothetical protein
MTTIPSASSAPKQPTVDPILIAAQEVARTVGRAAKALHIELHDAVVLGSTIAYRVYQHDQDARRSLEATFIQTFQEAQQ